MSKITVFIRDTTNRTMEPFQDLSVVNRSAAHNRPPAFQAHLRLALVGTPGLARREP